MSFLRFNWHFDMKLSTNDVKNHKKNVKQFLNNVVECTCNQTEIQFIT